MILPGNTATNVIVETKTKILSFTFENAMISSH